MMGSIASGSMAFNAQYANVVAAIFLATGQDIAHVVEGSLGVTTAEIQGEDLCLSVYLPDLLVGTVGGGTSLATQKEGLSMMGISEGSDGSDSQHFAEIIAAAVLAGELSLLSSLEQGTLAVAHKTLARGGANV
jgi:hydroxymethylglutaryl-CoA reductase (NADPH)